MPPLSRPPLLPPFSPSVKPSSQSVLRKGARGIAQSSPSSSPRSSPLNHSKTLQTPKIDDNDAHKKSLEQAVQDAVSKYGSTHPKCAVLYNQLGNAHFRQGNYAQAKEYYQNAACCDPCFCTASAYLNLGTVYWRMCETDQAIQMIQQALDCHEANLVAEEGKQTTLLSSPFAASAYHQIGLCHALHNQFESALDFLKKALAIRQRIKSPVEEAKTLSALAKVMTMKGDKLQAVACLEQCCRILASKHALSAVHLSNLANAYEEINENGKALALYKELLTIYGQESSDATKRAATEEKVKQLMEKVHEAGTSLHNAPRSLDIPGPLSLAVL